LRGKEDHEKDTTTVHHDGSGATFGRRDGLGGSPRSDSGAYGSALPRDHTPHTSPHRRGPRRQHHGDVLRGDEHEEPRDLQPLHLHFLVQDLLPPARQLHRLSPTKNPPRFCTNTATGTTAA